MWEATYLKVPQHSRKAKTLKRARLGNAGTQPARKTASQVNKPSARRARPAVDWPIQVMISSRCAGRFDHYGTLSEMRVALQKELSTATIFDRQLVQVILSEDFSAGPATQSSWDDCLRAIDEAHLVLVLYNGDSGSVRNPQSQIGICHEEFRYAYERAPERVRVISLGALPSLDDLQRDNDKIFRRELPRSFIPRVQSYEELVRESGNAIAQAILRNFTLGLTASRRDAFSQGTALDWTRLDFATRAHVMRQALVKALQGRAGVVGPRLTTFRKLEDATVLWVCHAVPAAMSIAAARELFGQPFLRDFELADHMRSQSAIGPLHVVACHRGVTEAQAIGQLGFPDATIVPLRFGVYVADDTQGIQILFLEDCRTEAAIRDQVDAALEWLENVGENELLLKRARMRAQIVDLVDQTHRSWEAQPS
jgi:hypothetical protein